MSSGAAITVITGHVVHVSEVRETPSGTPVCNVSVAVDESGPRGQESERWDVAIFGPGALAAVDVLYPGRLVWVSGKAGIRMVEVSREEEEARLTLRAHSWRGLGPGPAAARRRGG